LSTAEIATPPMGVRNDK